MFELQIWLIELTIGFVASFYSMGLTHAAALCTIGWIFYQFIERRRLNQTNIDEFFRKQFTDQLKTVEEQRRSFLDSFSGYRTSTPLATVVAVTWAYLKRSIWFLYRLIRLRFNHVSVPHAMLLFECGARDAAMDEFEKASDQFLQTAKLYSQQARIKKNEAVNALLYAGRVAAIQNDGETTLAAFKKALKLRDGDLDARKLIGEQFRQAGNFTAALEQFEFIAASNAAKRDKARLADAYRLAARVYQDKGELADARLALEKSLAIEKDRENFEGIAETSERLGDILVKLSEDTDQAEAAYRLATENYQTLVNATATKRVRRKLQHIRSTDTALSRLAEHIGRYFTETIAKRLRVPAKMP
jgi:tetratricopeptide (TPR) repeat protein